MTRLARFGLLLSLLSSIGLSGILFEDDFSDGTADGWTELPTGATYFVSGEWYHMVHSGPDDVVAGSYNGDQSGSMSVPDYTLLTEIYPREGESGPMVRFAESNMTGYWLMLRPSDNLVALVRMDPSGPVILDSAMLSLEYYEYYWARIEINVGMIGGKVWQGTPGDEPTAWLLTATDNTYSDPGSICLFCHDSNEGATASLHNDYDNVEVRDDLTLELDATTWGAIKGSFSN